MNVAVLGAGALGSLYGAWSADAGHDVVLVGRPPHVDAIREHGLTVLVDRGTPRTVHVRAATTADAADDADVVLVACKAQDTMALLDAHGGSPTAAWSVQNGARQADPLVARYGAAAIGCASMTGATLERPGVVTHTFSGRTYLGTLPTSADAALDAVVVSLGSAADVERREDILGVMWSKAVLAAAAMGTSILLRLPYHHVFVEPGARRVFHRLVVDGAAVASAAGVDLIDLPGPLQAGSLVALSPADALDRLAALGQAMVSRGETGVRVSMLQSLESGRRLEVDAVFGGLIAVADDHRLEVPVLRAVADVAATLDTVIGHEP